MFSRSFRKNSYLVYRRHLLPLTKVNNKGYEQDGKIRVAAILIVAGELSHIEC